MTRTAILLGGLFLLSSSACSSGDVTDTSIDALGKKKYHYEPTVNDVTFNPGCGIKPLDPSTDCSFGFVMNYVKDYVDLETTVTHTTNNTNHTVEITVDTWSYSQIHSMIAVRPEDDDLGMLGTKVGETYKVTVQDRKHVVLWTGKVATLYHM
jgi:hypothetical protein